MQDEIIANINAAFDARIDRMIHLLEGLQSQLPLSSLRALAKAPLVAQKPSAPPPSALPSAPPAPKPCAQTTPPELPPQLIPTRSYPPPPSVETIEEVEQKQVYKPLRNVKQMRQKHASKKMPTSETPSFEKCIGWPPKFGGINMRFSRDEEPDAWYTTMLQARARNKSFTKSGLVPCGRTPPFSFVDFACLKSCNPFRLFRLFRHFQLFNIPITGRSFITFYSLIF